MLDKAEEAWQCTDTSTVTNNDGYAGTSGSGALAASSEVDLPYLSRNGSWAVDNTSPTMTASGTTSPVRHRGSGPLPLPDASPYLTTSRPAIGQGPGVANNRTQGKAALILHLALSNTLFSQRFLLSHFPTTKKMATISVVRAKSSMLIALINEVSS